MRPRIPLALAVELGLDVQFLSWIGEPTAEVWIEVLGRDSYFRAIVDAEATCPVIGWMALKCLDLIVDGEPPALRRRDPDYIIAEV